MSIYQPYTYHLYHIPTGKHYYGVRYAKGCHPSDLWVKYFSSSKRVKNMIRLYGKDSFVVQIRKTFTNEQSARLWEATVLRRLKVITREEWLNQNDSMSPPSPRGIKRSDETRKLMSDVQKGKKFSKEHKNKMSQAKSKLWKITIPTGEIIIIRNLKKYCEDNSLILTCMMAVARNKRKTHKKHICERVIDSNYLSSDTSIIQKSQTMSS